MVLLVRRPMEETMDMTVANTIVQQLGGSKFKAMTGATSFSAGPDSVSFRLPQNLTKDRIKGVVIKLDPDDTYSVRFLRMKHRPMIEVECVKEVHGIYCDQLLEVFERTTGLATRL
jgi:hypothetical protein